MLLPGIIGIIACSGGGSSSPGTTSSGAGTSTSSTSSSGSSGSSSSGLALYAFTLPYDDAIGGVTHFGEKLNHEPAGSLGPVRSESGQFRVGDERIRFWGVNITGPSSFPTQDVADRVAARLAKFGVNIVRFHHMENNWGSRSLLDYSAGTSQTLKADSLDRLDYFISQLKSHGIYTNINLMTSREFLPGDGLPDSIMELDWKQRQILGMVMPEVRDLEKEFARNLLTHVNPYTNLSYAQDPAIAFIEINNENSLFQQYLDGSLDDWPEDLTSLLQQQWNTWLADRYESSEAVNLAWKAVDEPLGAQLLVNGDFSNGIAPWHLEQHEAATAAAVAGTYDGVPGVRITTSQASSAGWHVQFLQSGIGLIEDQIYTLDFRAKSGTTRSVSVGLQQGYDPWQTYDNTDITTTGDWQQWSHTFIAPATDSNVRINFSGLGSSLGDFYLANLLLRPGGRLCALPEGQTLEDRNIDITRAGSRYTQERINDWAAFLYSMENAYWTEMRTLLHDELNISGLAYGTIASLSPLSIQQDFGFLDGHAYWCHPEFPVADWDAANWRVCNTSMINQFNNPLDDLAKQRVKGLPFTVSEYQHALPNRYAAEGPLLIAAYGALQDWDGVYFFTYEADAKEDWDSNYFASYFQTNQHPALMTNIAAAANIFRRGDVEPATNRVDLAFDLSTEMNILATTARSWRVTGGSHLDIPVGNAFTSAIALDTSPDSATLTAAPEIASITRLVSDTGQLEWNTQQQGKGFVQINTDKTKAVLGFIENKEYTLGNITLGVGALQQDWATLVVTAQTGSFVQLEDGASLLAVVTGKVENTDMQWTDASQTSVGRNWGRAPVLIESVPYTLSLPVEAHRVQAWALSTTGTRSAPLEIQQSEGVSQVVVEGGAGTLWYEIVVTPE